MLGNTQGLGDNSFFAGCLVSCHSNLLNSLPFGVNLHRWGSAVPIHTFPSALPWGGLFIIMWGVAANLGGVPSSAFSVLKSGCWDFTIIGEIGHDALSTNKLSEAGKPFGHGASSLFCRAMAVAAASGCCSSGGLLLLGAERPPFSWDFLVG